MADPSTNVYLRGMPRALMREVKGVAARRGKSLASVVTDALVRCLENEHGGHPDHDALEDDMAWYERNRSRLVQRYDGQYVAIVGREVIDHGDDFADLAQRVFARLGTRSVFMPRVQPEGRRVHVRSPRRAAR